MRFSSHRSKVSILFSSLALFVLAGTFVFYGISGRGAHASAASASSFGGTLAKIQASGTVNVSSLPTSQVTPTGKTRVMVDLARPNGYAPAIAGSRPHTLSVKVANGTLLQNFDGVNAIDSKFVNGFDLEPPDEGLGVGKGYVFNIVNLAGTIYSTNGTRVVGPFNLNNFFREPAKANLSDPRAFYDKASGAWFSTILEYTLNAAGTLFTESHVDIAVNPSGNPTTSWTVYRIDTTNAGGKNPVSDAGCPCLADYPIFGIDQYNVYLSTNEFSGDGRSFNGAQVYAVSKAQLVSRATTVNYAHFGSLSVGGTIAYRLQPATTYGNAPAEYFMNTLDPNGTFDNRIGVWALTNRANIATGVIPNLSATVVSSEAYANTVNAQTPAGFNPRFKAPTTGLVDAGGDVMQEIEYINGHLVGAAQTSVTIAGESVARDGFAWFDVTPSVAGGVISSKTHVSRQGYLSLRGEYLLYPHIARSADGTTVVAFSYGGPSTYLSSAYAVLGVNASNFGDVLTAASGAAPDNGFTGTAKYGGVGRWGDYSAGQLDPTTNNLWFATQYIAGTGTSLANWSNRVFEVKA